MITTSKQIETLIQPMLAATIDPYLGTDFLSAKLLQGIKVVQGNVLITLRIGYPIRDYPSTVLTQFKRSVDNCLPDMKVTVQLKTKVAQHTVANGVKSIPGIKNIIAVGSGKGGVGKSTTSINLALALQQQGATVGLLDADIYGPNQPLLLGIKEKPMVRVDKRFIPVHQYGLQTMSMGYLLEEDAPLVWRGPMISRAFEQMLNETVWSDLDYLIIDLPPGTGDIQLTLAQKVPATAAVIVTTPQEVALQDARKAAKMFEKVNIPILGVIENMGLHICSQCGHSDPIFGQAGGQALAEQHSIPLLGSLPLDRRIREHTDDGSPIVLSEINEIVEIYQTLACQVGAKLSQLPRDFTAIKPRVIENN